MRHRRKSKTHVVEVPNSKIPKSFVLKKGIAPGALGTLVRDMRSVMEPNTAIKLKERRRNKLRDYVDMAGPLGVSHALVFARTGSGISLRIGRIPRGPTLSFKVESYSLRRDIRAMQTKPSLSSLLYKTAPLVRIWPLGC